MGLRRKANLGKEDQCCGLSPLSTLWGTSSSATTAIIKKEREGLVSRSNIVIFGHGKRNLK